MDNPTQPSEALPSGSAKFAEHTPGPWAISYGFSGLNGCRIVGRGDKHVATITRKADKPIDQKLADAHLIAAAPDMLAALQTLLGMLATDDKSGMRYSERIAMARTAIAKAGGAA